MTRVFNSIEIGFEWTQALTLGAGMIVPGDTLRAEFRYAPEDPEPIFAIASGDGIEVDQDTVTIVVSPGRTALITPPTEGWKAVFTELVRVPASGPEASLGFRLRIPAVLPVTRALG